MDIEIHIICDLDDGAAIAGEAEQNLCETVA